MLQTTDNESMHWSLLFSLAILCSDTRSPVQLSTGLLCSLNPDYLQQPAPLGGLRRRNLPKCEFPFGPELPFSAADS